MGVLGGGAVCLLGFLVFAFIVYMLAKHES